jgi:NodT family efflux transporter outer membrane factor (OMF) lipoprotein
MTTREILSLVLIAVYVTGCSVHRPQPTDSTVSIPLSFSEETGTPSSEEMHGRWWEAFHDPKLNALMSETLQNNPDIRMAYARLEQVQAIARATSAAQYPFLGAGGEGTREKTPSFLGDYTGDSYRLSLSAGYELDVWKKYASLTNAAELETDASLEDIKALYMSLSAQLAELYYLAVEQRAQLSLTDRTIASFEDTLNRVQLRYHEGLSPALDLYQAQQTLARVRSDRPGFESTLAVTEHAITTLLGRFPGEESSGQLSEIPAVPIAFPDGLPSDILARRPDVHAALLRLRASDEMIANAIADRFPAFNLLGSYGKSSTAFVTGDIVGVFWNLMVSLAQPILDGGKRSAEVDRARAVFEENLALYHRAVLTAFHEVEDALSRNRASEEHIALLNAQIAYSSDALRLSTDNYMEGLSDYLPVLAAQQGLYQSEAALLSARRQLISDRIRLARALGGEWTNEFIRDRYAAQREEEQDK